MSGGVAMTSGGGSKRSASSRDEEGGEDDSDDDDVMGESVGEREFNRAQARKRRASCRRSPWTLSASHCHRMKPANNDPVSVANTTLCLFNLLFAGCHCDRRQKRWIPRYVTTSTMPRNCKVVCSVVD